MKDKQKVTKREGVLLGMTAVFLCLLAALFLWDLRHTVTPREAALNVNTASAAELAALPGIGAELAERIVAYREEHGPFASVDELGKVPGMGEKRLSALGERVCVNGGAA